MARTFFTIPDPELTQESSFDPMGIMPIWMKYGQSLFHDKLTTIANDVRVFTFNLFHHYILFELFKKHGEEIEIAKHKYKGWKTDADIKAGLLIFLEDLVAHIFYLEGSVRQDIDNIGILGYSKARQAHSSDSRNSVFLTANKNAGLLKNQLNLGMTGRYKGPMMNMRYYDRTFSYIQEEWDQVARFIEKWTPAIQLKEQLTKLFLKQVFFASGKEAPLLPLQDIKSSRLWRPVTDGYLSCFGKRKLPLLVKSYWKDKLGLNSGAPAVLYAIIATQRENPILEHEKIFRRALKDLNKEPFEAQKIQRILDVEYFLSYSEYLARFLSQSSIKKISDVRVELQRMRAEIKNVAGFVLDPDLPRLSELVKAMTTEGSLDEWLQSVLSYHRKISISRGGGAWFEIDESGILRHNFSPNLNEKFNTIDKYLEHPVWWHTYYLETLRSIYNSIQ